MAGAEMEAEAAEPKLVPPLYFLRMNSLTGASAGRILGGYFLQQFD
jgi:hypothetical protein